VFRYNIQERYQFIVRVTKITIWYFMLLAFGIVLVGQVT